MIISGGSRRNWQFFAGHLTNAKDNERITVKELRGVYADNVRDALREMDAVASGSKTKNFFYHADINPAEEYQLTPEQWEQAIDTLERNMGLEGQPRLVVEHEKEGRTHCHVIWSRIDADTMTAISDSRNYATHERTSRELETLFGHEAVKNCVTRDTPDKRPERRPKNWETFRGNKSGIDPEQVKQEATALWQESDSGEAFKAALEEKGYILCKGDKRDFCLIDPAGQEHSLARRLNGVKAAEVRARLADIDRDNLPTVAEGRAAARQADTLGSAAAIVQEEMQIPAHHIEPADDDRPLVARSVKEREVIAEAELGPLLNDIRTNGEVTQRGMGDSWLERMQNTLTQYRERAAQFWQESREKLADTWRGWVKGSREKADMEISR